MGGPGRLFHAPLRRLRNRALRAAETNVVLGKRMAEHLCKQGIPQDRTRIIANWQDGVLVRPVAHSENRLRRAWGLEGKFVVGYSGNLGRVHELATLLDAMTLLQAQAVMGSAAADVGVEVRFLFIGGGALERVLRDEIAARGLYNVVLLPYQSRNELSHSLSVADAHLVTLRPEFEGLIVPSKFYGIAAVGRPNAVRGRSGRRDRATDRGTRVRCERALRRWGRSRCGHRGAVPRSCALRGYGAACPGDARCLFRQAHCDRAVGRGSQGPFGRASLD